MNEGLDTGDLVAQLPFSVDPAWTQTEYYNHAFELVGMQLAEILDQLASGQIQREPQPVESPTPIASRFTKEDGFVPWEAVRSCFDREPQAADSNSSVDSDPAIHLDTSENSALSPILSAALSYHGSWAQLIHYATKALFPWPGVWTVIPTAKGQKRMKILSTEIIVGSPTKIQLQQVQIEGKEPARWDQVKNIIQE
jgi:methionyl-tRNA formyltransferase